MTKRIVLSSAPMRDQTGASNPADRACLMPARVSFASIAAGFIVPEGVFLFCIASDTDWFRARVATTSRM
jgi:hypothetical protein